LDTEDIGKLLLQPAKAQSKLFTIPIATPQGTEYTSDP
jgi:hypothetical protein